MRQGAEQEWSGLHPHGAPPWRVVQPLCTSSAVHLAVLSLSRFAQPTPALPHLAPTATNHLTGTRTWQGIYYSHQLVIAQTMGAAYAAPYLGRMSDVHGREEVGARKARSRLPLPPA